MRLYAIDAADRFHLTLVKDASSHSMRGDLENLNKYATRIKLYLVCSFVSIVCFWLFGWLSVCIDFRLFVCLFICLFVWLVASLLLLSLIFLTT
jgi:hypothetical protein